MTDRRTAPTSSSPRRLGRIASALCLGLALTMPLNAADDSWLSFETGKRLYEERRFGEALNAWKRAVELRKTQFAQARARIETALADREAGQAKGSIQALIGIFAKRDIIDREYRSILERSGGSLRKQAELLGKHRLADGFLGFLEALTLVLDHRPAARIGDSLEALRQAAAELTVYPEAEYWIGRVYLVEGELRLAELQFRRAYDMREALEIPEDRFAILMSLVGIYRDAERWRDYEDTLSLVARAAPVFREEEAFLRDAMERSLARDGFDKFMVLYRIGDGASLAANAELGEFYLRNGRPQALIHLAIAVNGMLTRCIERIKESEPSYVYGSLPELLGRIARDRELVRFIADTRLGASLYYLGEALNAQGYRDSARGILRALAAAQGFGPWSQRATAALARPAGIAGPPPLP